MPELVCAADDPRWPGERRRGVTATDIPVILGLSAYDSPYSLWHRKRGGLPEVEDNDRFRLGRYLEQYVAERWQAERNREAGFSATFPCLWRHSDRAWQLATTDRMTEAKEPLECKSWADADRRRWDDGPPPAVRAQILWQMGVMGVAAGHWAVVFLPSGEFLSGVIEHSGGFVPCVQTGNGCVDECQVCQDQALMVKAGEEFHQLTEPPSADGSAASLAALKHVLSPVKVESAAEVPAELWERYDTAKVGMDNWEVLKKAAEAKLREAIGDAGIIQVDGETVGWRNVSVVKAHHRKATVRDSIKRAKTKEDDE